MEQQSEQPKPAAPPAVLTGANVTARAFPALARLGFQSNTARIPYVQQMQITDCGAACLAMVLGYHGRETSLSDTRNELRTSRDGVNAADIMRAAERYGMTGRGVRLDVDDLDTLPRASILHWEFNHFVVFDRVTRDGVRIVDPAKGPRLVSHEDFSNSFTGIAIQLTPVSGFQVGDLTARKPMRALFASVLTERAELVRVMVLSLLLRLFSVTAPLLIGLIVDKVVPRGDYRLLFVVAAGLSAMVFFEVVTEFIRGHLMLRMGTKLDTRSTLSFLDHMVSLPISFFQTRSGGDLLMRVGNNSSIRQTIANSTMGAILDGGFGLFYVVIVVWASPSMAALVLGLSSLHIIMFLATRNRYRDFTAADLEARVQCQSWMMQMLEGIQTLKCAAAEHRAVRKWSNLYVDELNISLRYGAMQMVVDGIRGALGRLSPILVLTLGAVHVMSGQMSLGTMLAVNALAMAIFGPVSTLVGCALQMQLIGSMYERIADVTEAPREQDRSGVTAAPPLRGSIKVENVSFRYTETGPLVLDGVSLEVPSGTTLALVGSSGSGKLTLGHLLATLYLPTSGRISFDGHLLDEMDVYSIRRQIGIVPQKPYMFAGSIKDNIALTFPEADMSAILRAAECAAILDDIRAMPLQFDTPVSAGGTSISGGQQQRVAIARAVLPRPPILLLDEATSALDTLTEDRVTANLDQLAATRIVIAHRLSTIMRADRIAVLDQGKLVEIGTHAELMASGGHYSRLVRRQNDAN